MRRKHPIKRFSDGKIRRWSAKKDESDTIEICKNLSQSPQTHEEDGPPKEPVAVVDIEPQGENEASSPKHSSDSGEDKSACTPPLARVQTDHGADSTTSSDECETEEEMRSLPPNQVGIDWATCKRMH